MMKRQGQREPAPTALARTKAAMKSKGDARVTATGPWLGDEVSRDSGRSSAAEAAATRAEGNGAVRADALERQPEQGTPASRGPARRPRANDPDAAENAEEKRQSAADEHAEQPSRRAPYGKL